MPKNYKLSKSKLLSFRQCPKRLWLQTHRPELAEIDGATLSVMASGTHAGEIFRETYPEGVLVDTDDLVSALAMTQALIASHPYSPIFEATFQANDVLVRIDMLAPVEGGYRLVEVKSSTCVKTYHLDDATIQTWVAQNAGIPILKTEIAHIDNRFVYQGNEQYKGLFVEENIGAAVAERLPQVSHWVREAQAMLQNEEPGICAGAQCYDPFACPFVAYCHRNVVQTEFPVEILPRNNGLAANLKAAGYADLRDVPEDRLEKTIHQKVLRVTKSGIAELNSDAGRLVRALLYPRYYLDFETIAFAVPRWANTRPYQQVPFQFSCHVELAPGTVAPSSFLSTDGTDPRRAFAMAVIEAVNPELLHDLGLQERMPGPVLVYNAAFERKRIEELAGTFPDLADALLAINERIVDLLPITRQHYYHAQMRGSWSLKAVLPTIGAGLGYDGLAVANGGMAQDAFLEMIDVDTESERKEALRQGLLDYCALDTHALLELVTFFSKGH